MAQPLWYPLLKDTARQYGLNAQVMAAMIAVESGNDPWAIRVEPGYLNNAVVLREAKEWSKSHQGIPTVETERYLRSCSFGLGQMLGQVAREYGCLERYLTALCEPACNLTWMATILSAYGKRASSEAHMLLMYNAGPRSRANPDTHPYVRKVYAQMARGEKIR